MGGGHSGLKGITNDERKTFKKIEDTVKSFANKRKGSKIEFGWRISLDGEFEQEFRGGAKSVLIADAQDKITVHWHPDQDGANGGPYSAQDLRVLVWRNERIQYVVDRDKIYWIRPQYWFKGNRINSTPLADAYKEASSKADEKSSKIRQKMMKKGMFDKPDGSVDWGKAWDYEIKIWNNMRVKWLQNNARNYGFEFGYYKIKG